MAIKSGNGLLLKGGSEAAKTCALLHKLVVDCLESVGVPREAVSLVHTRNDITQLLKCEKYIDLVIPRGSNQLVRHIKANTNIPVLGHADGVCHAFIDEKSEGFFGALFYKFFVPFFFQIGDEKMVLDIVLDAKLGYPAACNALETLLVHKSWLVDSRIDRLLRLLRSKGWSQMMESVLTLVQEFNLSVDQLQLKMGSWIRPMLPNFVTAMKATIHCMWNTESKICCDESFSFSLNQSLLVQLCVLKLWIV